MKKGCYEGILVLVWTVSGCLFGYGIHGTMSLQNQIEEQDAKDNTLLREEYDSVFFVSEKKVEEEAEQKEQDEKDRQKQRATAETERR